MKIVELRSESELKEGFPVMAELRTHLNEQQYLTLLATMMPN